jgi:hypothetical protein
VELEVDYEGRWSLQRFRRVGDGAERRDLATEDVLAEEPSGAIGVGDARMASKSFRAGKKTSQGRRGKREEAEWRR